MKKLCFLFMIVTLFGGCDDINPANEDYTAVAAVNTDTIPEEKIIAKYVDNKVLSIVLATDSKMTTAIKINYSKSEPVIADSLIRVGNKKYASKLFPSAYEFGDCDITQTQSMKTVHPSSNWQGQTPGEKNVTYTFRNIK